MENHKSKIVILKTTKLKSKPIQMRIRIHPGIRDYFKSSSRNYSSDMSQVILDYALSNMTEDEIDKFILPYEQNLESGE